MKIKKVKLTNFRNVPNGEYDLKGQSVFLMADNAKGKTNFQNAIRVALCKQLPGPNAIAAGTDEAEIEILAADYQTEWQVNEDGTRQMVSQLPIDGTDYRFWARISKTKKGVETAEFEVTMPNGIRDHKKTMIGGIVGELELKEDFVELSTTEAGRNKQIEELKKFMSDELRTILKVQEQRIGDVEADRTKTGNERDRYKALVDSSPVRNIDPKTIPPMVDTKKALEDLTLAQNRNRDHANGTEQLVFISKRLTEIEEEVDRLTKEAAQLTSRKETGDKWLKDHPPIDVAELEASIQNATTINAQNAQVEEFKKNETRYNELVEEYGIATAHIEAARETIRDAVRDFPMPIAGLEFDAVTSKITYNGTLLHPDMMSNAERKVFTAQLLMARMQNAEILFVGEGESIGLELLRAMQIEAEKRGIQIIMEEVERGTEELRVDFMVMPPIPKD